MFADDIERMHGGEEALPGEFDLNQIEIIAE
jgi:hypothetical protein